MEMLQSQKNEEAAIIFNKLLFGSGTRRKVTGSPRASSLKLPPSSISSILEYYNKNETTFNAFCIHFTEFNSSQK